MVSFNPIPGKVVDIKEDWDDILNNNDVKHLHDLCLLVQLGPKVADEKLMNSFYKSLGHVHNARWITAASNVLVLYMQEEEPSKDLVLLVTYIINCYFPSFLTIKKTPHCSNGSRHIYQIVQLSRDLLEMDHPEVFSVVMGCIEDNSYYLHPENVVLSMVTDSDEKVRADGIQLIEKFRAQDEDRKQKCVGLMKLRTFRKPKNIDFSGKNYHSMVDFNEFDEYDVCSPPILRDYSIDDIKNCNFSEGFKKVPSHSQHVERFVALTSKAAECAVGYEQRHQWILNKMATCKKVPTSARKDDFVNLAKQKDVGKVKKKLCTDK